MNQKQRIKENQGLRDSFTRTYPEGCIKYSNTGILHFRVLCELLHWFKKEGYECWTEANLNGGGRADLICIKGEHGFIEEVLCSESEDRYALKMNTYPDNFRMIKIYAKEFNYDTFKL